MDVYRATAVATRPMTLHYKGGAGGFPPAFRGLGAETAPPSERIFQVLAIASHQSDKTNKWVCGRSTLPANRARSARKFFVLGVRGRVEPPKPRVGHARARSRAGKSAPHGRPPDSPPRRGGGAGDARGKRRPHKRKPAPEGRKRAGQSGAPRAHHGAGEPTPADRPTGGQRGGGTRPTARKGARGIGAGDGRRAQRRAVGRGQWRRGAKPQRRGRPPRAPQRAPRTRTPASAHQRGAGAGERERDGKEERNGARSTRRTGARSIIRMGARSISRTCTRTRNKKRTQHPHYLDVRCISFGNSTAVLLYRSFIVRRIHRQSLARYRISLVWLWLYLFHAFPASFQLSIVEGLRYPQGYIFALQTLPADAS